MRVALRVFILLLCCFCTWLACYYHNRGIISKIENANILVVSKQDMRLNLIDYKGDTLFCAPIAVGRAYGNKQEQGDMRTPEGVFKVVDIQNSSKWTHNFHDGKGEIEGAYGRYFIRLNVPGYKGIGIHGTHAPETIGSRATEGCVRLNNNDLEQLVALICPPLAVVITHSVMDEKENLRNKE